MEWIKVSDRNPEHGENVFVTARLDTPGCTSHRYVETAQYNADEDTYVVWDSYFEVEEPVEGVVAWMPYPTPYYGD
jgi:hypothetical protein